MTRELAYLVDVPDRHSRDTVRLRVAGLLPDGETIAVASMQAGDRTAVSELEFALGETLSLAEACLAGDQRALTTPGLTRRLSATLAILFRVAVERGAVIEQPMGGADGPDDERDRDQEDRDADLD